MVPEVQIHAFRGRDLTVVVNSVFGCRGQTPWDGCTSITHPLISSIDSDTKYRTQKSKLSFGKFVVLPFFFFFFGTRTDILYVVARVSQLLK